MAVFCEMPIDDLGKVLGPMDYRELNTRSVALMKTARKAAKERPRNR